MSEINPIVATKQGQIRGKSDTNYDGERYYSFHNIPYAKPPLGDLRFKAPQPPVPWEGIKDGTEEGDQCYSLHILLGKPIGSEDCLTLNVFTKELPRNQNNLKPVMVWIHGGGFTNGSSKIEFYGPDYLICEDVIIVSINYRVGALGFLAMKDPSLGVPGNAGLKDMVMALKWIQDNIRQFNGDPKNVTIFGESAGGAAVHFLILSPMAKGLFHKAILQSGCALNAWAFGSRKAPEMAEFLGCTSKDEKDLLKVLQRATADEIWKAQETCSDIFQVNHVRPHGPVIEQQNEYEESFLSEDPVKIIASGRFNKVPMIVGFTTREGMLIDLFNKITDAGVMSYEIDDFEKCVPYTLKISSGTPKAANVAQKIKKFYFGNQEPSASTSDNFYLLHTDNFFLRGIHSTIKNHLEVSPNTPIYYYRFAVDSNLNAYKILGKITAKGACHADDLGYMFRMCLTTEAEPGTLEERTIRRFTKFWTNFAHTGNPNPVQKDALIPVTWLPAKYDEMHFIDIGENLTVGINPEAERMEFWDGIYAMNPTTSKL